MACSLTLRAPIEVAYWTPEAEAIAEHGFPLRYEIKAYRALLSFVRDGVRDQQKWQRLTERAA